MAGNRQDVSLEEVEQHIQYVKQFLDQEKSVFDSGPSQSGNVNKLAAEPHDHTGSPNPMDMVDEKKLEDLQQHAHRATQPAAARRHNEPRAAAPEPSSSTTPAEEKHSVAGAGISDLDNRILQQLMGACERVSATACGCVILTVPLCTCQAILLAGPGMSSSLPSWRTLALHSQHSRCPQVNNLRQHAPRPCYHRWQGLPSLQHKNSEK